LNSSETTTKNTKANSYVSKSSKENTNDVLQTDSATGDTICAMATVICSGTKSNISMTTMNKSKMVFSPKQTSTPIKSSEKNTFYSSRKSSWASKTNGSKPNKIITKSHLCNKKSIITEFATQ
jgi:hypothetical protein